jgi:hypothetical protein
MAPKRKIRCSELEDGGGGGKEFRGDFGSEIKNIQRIRAGVNISVLGKRFGYSGWDVHSLILPIRIQSPFSSVLSDKQPSNLRNKHPKTMGAVALQGETRPNSPGTQDFLVAPLRQTLQFPGWTPELVWIPEFPAVLSSGNSFKTQPALDRREIAQIETLQFPAGDSNQNIRMASFPA